MIRQPARWMMGGGPPTTAPSAASAGVMGPIGRKNVLILALAVHDVGPNGYLGQRRRVMLRLHVLTVLGRTAEFLLQPRAIMDASALGRILGRCCVSIPGNPWSAQLTVFI